MNIVKDSPPKTRVRSKTNSKILTLKLQKQGFFKSFLELKLLFSSIFKKYGFVFSMEEIGMVIAKQVERSPKKFKRGNLNNHLSKNYKMDRSIK